MVAALTTNVNDGDRGSVIVAGTVMLTYAIPVMPVAPIVRGARMTFAGAGAGEGDELKTILAVAEPAVVAGNPIVAARPLLIGANVADTAEPPSAAEAADDAGSVGAGLGEALGAPPTGTTPALLPPQPAAANGTSNTTTERKSRSRK